MGQTPVTDKVERALTVCLHHDRERQCGNCPYYPCRNEKIKLRKDAVRLIQKLRDIEWKKWDKEHKPPSPKQKVYIQYGVRWRASAEELPEMGEVVVASDGVHAWRVMQFNGTARYSGRIDDTPNLEDWLYQGSVTTVKWWMPKKIALPPYPPEPSSEEEIIKEVIVETEKKRNKAVRKGVWERDETSKHRYICSYCKSVSAIRTDYCQRCGAKMRKEEADDDS